MRVPMDFSWPAHKVWKGYINPYAKLQVRCAACDFGEYEPRGYSPEGFRYHQEWYGHVSFDPIAYGAVPIDITHPRIREFATAQVNRHPQHFMTREELGRERKNLQRAGVDLIELMKTTEELKAELNSPASELEDLQKEGLVRIDNHRGPAIEREIKRLYEVCIKDHWSHHLIQADVDALVADGRLRDFTHRPRTQAQVEQLAAQEAASGSGYWLEEPNGHHPTAEEVNTWSLFGMSHDSINAWCCMHARAAREGVELTCQACAGSGYLWVDVEYDDLPRLTEGLLKPDAILAIKPIGKMVPAATVEQLCEEWKDYDPPEGPGFQLWETTSEGSPVSPVFASIEELCEHCEKHQSTFGTDNFVSKECWREMLEADFVHHTETRADGGSNIFM